MDRIAWTVPYWSSSAEGRSVTFLGAARQTALSTFPTSLSPIPTVRSNTRRRITDGALGPLAHSALGAHPETLAQEPLQYFASPVLRQIRLRELQMAGHLVIGQPLATMDNQCFRGDVHARL